MMHVPATNYYNALAINPAEAFPILEAEWLIRK
jgi:hypothetical protein